MCAQDQTPQLRLVYLCFAPAEVAGLPAVDGNAIKWLSRYNGTNFNHLATFSKTGVTILITSFHFLRFQSNHYQTKNRRIGKRYRPGLLFCADIKKRLTQERHKLFQTALKSWFC